MKYFSFCISQFSWSVIEVLSCRGSFAFWAVLSCLGMWYNFLFRATKKPHAILWHILKIKVFIGSCNSLCCSDEEHPHGTALSTNGAASHPSTFLNNWIVTCHPIEVQIATGRPQKVLQVSCTGCVGEQGLLHSILPNTHTVPTVVFPWKVYCSSYYTELPGECSWCQGYYFILCRLREVTSHLLSLIHIFKYSFEKGKVTWLFNEKGASFKWKEGLLL